MAFVFYEIAVGTAPLVPAYSVGYLRQGAWLTDILASVATEISQSDARALENLLSRDSALLSLKAFRCDPLLSVQICPRWDRSRERRSSNSAWVPAVESSVSSMDRTGRRAPFFGALIELE
jgi:hypothetical protein